MTKDERVEEFAQTIIRAGIPAMYGIVRAPEETDEQLMARLRIFLYEKPSLQ